ncbi:EKC/KEOPS complex subunit LAGE3-like [Leptonychotes weddellii]|uniref:L antigen family member 3 n=1 Tax=Leptonychotes weddellii TaxID=9713 RepID=A0A7F8RB68_LEPWE|nr:EKC/KEOPS complex subunit LAGE3-like [Leptonychotes weddellii]
MQAPDGSAGGAEGGAGAPTGPGSPGEPGGWGGTAAEGTVAGGAPQVEGASFSPRQGEEASALALASGEASGNQLSEFTLTVPFLCHMDAEVARQYLTLGAELFHGAVQTELTVTGRDLLIKVTAEDSALLQISTASLLNQLSMVVQTMQHFVPLFFAKPWPETRG